MFDHPSQRTSICEGTTYRSPRNRFHGRAIELKGLHDPPVPATNQIGEAKPDCRPLLAHSSQRHNRNGAESADGRKVNGPQAKPGNQQAEARAIHVAGNRNHQRQGQRERYQGLPGSDGQRPAAEDRNQQPAGAARAV